MKKKFIYTTSKETADVLRKKGLLEVAPQSTNGWTFVNDDKIRFELNDKTIYTNKLFM